MKNKWYAFDGIPRGLLIQNIANEASNGKSGSTLSTYVPDGKKMIIQDAIAVVKTLSTDPKNTLNTVKSVSVSNVNTIKNLESVKLIEKVAKPTILEVVKKTEIIKPVVVNTLLTAKRIDIPMKPTILDIHKVIATPVLAAVLPILFRVVHSLAAISILLQPYAALLDWILRVHRLDWILRVSTASSEETPTEGKRIIYT
jgi:hypothetical protein